jgi:hypothetical protein
MGDGSPPPPSRQPENTPQMRFAASRSDTRRLRSRNESSTSSPPWTVIPVTASKVYTEALENASVGEDIEPFTEFMGGLVERRLAGEPLPGVPKP